MTHPWTPHVAIDAERARELIRARFTAVPATRVDPLGAGWDNSAFVVDDRWVFRFAHRPEGVPLLAREADLLPRLAPRLPLSIPDPRFLADDGPDHPWPFLGYARVPGRTLCVARLPDSLRADMAKPLGAFLEALHAIGPTEVGLPVVDHVRTRPVGERRGILEERLAALEDRGLAESADRVRLRFDAETRPERRPRADTLVHGDLYARHLLVDDGGALTGVIDWGDVHVGDPALDLMVMFTMIPASARPDFLDAYGSVDGATLAEARRWGLFHAATVAWYGDRTDDEDLRREGAWSLEQALSD